MSEKLAIEGGPKAVRNKLTPWPQFDEKAIKAVEEVLRSGKFNYWAGERRPYMYPPSPERAAEFFSTQRHSAAQPQPNCDAP